jgi:ribosomal protein S17E
MNIATEYQVSKMEKELKELSTFFEDNKKVIDLVATLNDKYSMNKDILTLIINNYLH